MITPIYASNPEMARIVLAQAAELGRQETSGRSQGIFVSPTWRNSTRPVSPHHPLWNLYVPRDQLEAAQAFLRRDWSGLLDDPEAAAAAERGLAGIDLDAGGELECPACGHRFTAQGSAVECPECGLSLGAPSDAAPD